jgi:hypothetical protein
VGVALLVAVASVAVASVAVPFGVGSPVDAPPHPARTSRRARATGARRSTDGMRGTGTSGH